MITRKLVSVVLLAALLCAASVAGFAQEFDVAVSWMYGSDATLHRSLTGTQIGMILTYPASGLAVVPDVTYVSSTGKLYAVSNANNQIKEFNAQTGALERILVSGNGVNGPYGISAYGDHIYCANQGTGTITRYALATGEQDMGYTVSAASPMYISHDASGNIYVASSQAGGSKAFSPSGTLLKTFAANPAGGSWVNIAIDSQGRVYGVGTGYPSSYLYRFKADGSIDSAFTRVPLSDAAASPNAAKFGPDGNIYLAQTGNDWAVTRYTVTDTGGAWDNTFRAGRTDVNTYPSSMAFLPALQKVDTPGISPDGALISDPIQVTITCATAGATIHYTTDGTDPTESSAAVVSGGTVTVAPGTTLNARGFKTGMQPSDVKIATFLAKVQTPVFTPDGRAGATDVTITCPTSGVTIRYTLDGTDPDEGSQVIANGGTVAVEQGRTLKAKAWKTGITPSEIWSDTYTGFDIAVSWMWQSDATRHGATTGSNIGFAIPQAGSGLAAIPDLTYVPSMGKLYAASLYNNQIRVFNPQTGALEGILVSGSGVSSPNSISAYGDHIYSANQGTNTITRYSLATGAQDLTYSISVASPAYIDHDSDGNLYVGSLVADGSKAFSQNTTLLKTFASNPAGGYWMNIVLDSQDRAYGVGFGLGSAYLYRFNADGSIDESFTRVSISVASGAPYGAEFGPDGNLYVALTANDWAVHRYILTETGGSWDGSFRAGRTDVNTYPSSVAFIPAPLRVDTPVFTPDGGLIFTQQQVTVTCWPEDATIHCTTDGSEPDETSPTVANGGTVAVTPGMTLKAQGFRTGLGSSDIKTALYSQANRPQMIPYATSVPIINGDLSDWSGAEWTPLDKMVHNPTDDFLNDYLNARDIAEAYYTVKWREDKVYVAVKVRDTAPIFTDDYTWWDVRDALEYFIHTTGTESQYDASQSSAQHYHVGIKGSNNQTVWATLKDGSMQASITGSEFAGRQDGQWLYYEGAIVPYKNFNKDNPSQSELSPLSAGQVIGFDVCPVANDGTAMPTGCSDGYTGTKGENMVGSKFWDFNNFGIHMLAGTETPTSGTIAEVKDMADNDLVTTTGTVTAVFGDVFYIESTNRSSGLRVQKTGHGVAAGWSVTVTGRMATITDTDERYINATAAGGSMSAKLGSLGMSNKSLGGSGVATGSGVNSVGLYVKAWGRLTSLGGGLYSLNDGSDSEVTVKLASGSISGMPYVSVTGVISSQLSGGSVKRLILVESASDVRTF